MTPSSTGPCSRKTDTSSTHGDLPLSRLDIVNGQIVELPEPEPEPVPRGTVFTKLQIRRAMRKLGQEALLDQILEMGGEIAKDWNDAQVIDLADPVLLQALEEFSISENEINKVIDVIEGRAAEEESSEDANSN